MISDGTPEYRFAPPGHHDEPKVVCHCALWGGEIYEGAAVTTATISPRLRYMTDVNSVGRVVRD
jgi:hypothetical protein